MKIQFRFAAAIAVASLLLLTIVACRDPGVSPPKPPSAGPSAETHEALFSSAIDLLASPENSDPDEAQTRIVDLLNQWIRNEPTEPEWKAEPMVGGLPLEIRETLKIKSRLNEREFTPQYDGRFLQEAALLRDIARHVAAGEINNKLLVAERLFDWTVRQIQLEPDPGQTTSAESLIPWTGGQHLAWEIMLHGRGTAVERAWIFALLARQQNMNVVLLARPEAGKVVKIWTAALVHEGELYLFDPRLGLPLTKPDGKIATLSELAADDSLLRQYDVTVTGGNQLEDPVKADDLQKLDVFLEASPGYLSRRMRIVEQRLAGDRRIVLSTQPSVLTEELKTLSGVGDVRIWSTPYQVLIDRVTKQDEKQAAMESWAYYWGVPPQGERPDRATEESLKEYGPSSTAKTRKQKYVFPFRAGRLLMLRGMLDGPQGAKAMLLMARLDDKLLEELAKQKTPTEMNLFEYMKQNATYWLGLVTHEAGDHAVSAEYFRRTIKGWPGTSRAAASRYHIGRALEAEGKSAEAITAYQADRSLQRHGSLVRAKHLEAKTDAKPAEEKPADNAAKGETDD